jgi:hypothetical protein
LTSLLLALRHKTLLSYHACLPFPPPTTWRSASASTSLPNASTVTSLVTTHSSAPSNLSATGAHNHTLLGITPAPQLPAPLGTAYAHTLHHCFSTAAVPIQHTPQPVPNAKPLRPVKGMRLWMTSRLWALRWKVHLRGSLFYFFGVVLWFAMMGKQGR